ncbi:MAG: hypothetical protein LBD84_01675, partial [Campylobacteraceae bacterium]|nr:hypothetical protein [Campylobacteraceae bacterium]
MRYNGKIRDLAIKKEVKLCICGILLFSTFSLADENTADTNSTSEITQLAEIKVVGSKTASSGGGLTVIDGDYIQNAPSATHTITDLLRGKSYIQYDQTSRDSATGGEIAPPKISINGGKHFENNFLINGVSNNNNIYPSGLSLN